MELSLQKGAQQGAELPVPTTTRSGVPVPRADMPPCPHAATSPRPR